MSNLVAKCQQFMHKLRVILVVRFDKRRLQNDRLGACSITVAGWPKRGSICKGGISMIRKAVESASSRGKLGGNEEPRRQHPLNSAQADGLP